MGLQEEISSQIKIAMKARDKQRTGVLRMLLSELQYARTATDASVELTEEQAVKVIRTYHKRLTKSLADFPDEGKRSEIKEEIAIVDTFLPASASMDDIQKAVDEVMSDNSDQNFGVLMKAVLAKLGGNADGKVVSEQIKSKLSALK